MKIAKVLIIVAALFAVAVVISRFAAPVAGLTARGLMGFTGLLLLFAIALEGLK